MVDRSNHSLGVLNQLLRAAWRAKNVAMIKHYTNIILARAERGELESKQPPKGD
jgi:hypothetical protein